MSEEQDREEKLRMFECEEVSLHIEQKLNGRSYLMLYQDMYGGISECSANVGSVMRMKLGTLLLTRPPESENHKVVVVGEEKPDA